MSLGARAYAALVVAALLEVGGDYAIRFGRTHPDRRLLTTAIGMGLLALYGVAVTYYWKGAFSRLLGLYVVVFLVVSQAWGRLVDGDDLTLAHVFGAAMIVGGGLVIQFWGRAAG